MELRMGNRSNRARDSLLSRTAAVCVALVCVGLQAQTTTAIPNFAPDDHTSWYPDRPDGDNFLPPESGPGPIVSRADHPYVPNSDVGDDFAASHPTYRI